MALLFRWLVRIIVTLIALTVVGIGMVYYLAAQSLPDYDTTRPARGGLHDRVEIVRNNANVPPHIFGTNDEDVFFGLGYAHAQDRLWQMTMMRRTAQGRLSEVFGGARTLEVDELMRRLDIYRLAQQAVAVQDDDTKAALRAYARGGVNAWLQRVNDEALGRGAPEFFLFAPDIAPPWQPADSLAVLKLMGVQMAGHLQEEVLRARTGLALSPDRLQDILPDMPGNGVAALPDFASLFPGVDPARDFAAHTPRRERPPFLSPVAPPRGLAGASNAWAAAPARSAAGGTLLANDPHLGGLSAPPSVWYLARLELSSGGGVIGGTIPGMPLVLAGRSADFGWGGITSSYLDDQDIFIEELNPADPSKIRTPPDGWARLERRPTIIQVKDAQPVTITLEWSPNGPVLPGHLYDLGTVTPPRGHVAAIGWTLLTSEDRSMSAGGLALMRAHSIREGIAAGRMYTAPPSQNLVMVDAENIAMKTIGAMPPAAMRATSPRAACPPPPAGAWKTTGWGGSNPMPPTRNMSPPRAAALSATPTTRSSTAPPSRAMSVSTGGATASACSAGNG